jgi:hypothetical protein
MSGTLRKRVGPGSLENELSLMERVQTMQSDMRFGVDVDELLRATIR